MSLGFTSKGTAVGDKLMASAGYDLDLKSEERLAVQIPVLGEVSVAGLEFGAHVLDFKLSLDLTVIINATA